MCKLANSEQESRRAGGEAAMQGREACNSAGKVRGSGKAGGRQDRRQERQEVGRKSTSTERRKRT